MLPRSSRIPSKYPRTAPRRGPRTILKRLGSCCCCWCWLRSPEPRGHQLPVERARAGARIPRAKAGVGGRREPAAGRRVATPSWRAEQLVCLRSILRSCSAKRCRGEPCAAMTGRLACSVKSMRNDSNLVAAVLPSRSIYPLLRIEPARRPR